MLNTQEARDWTRLPSAPSHLTQPRRSSTQGSSEFVQRWRDDITPQLDQYSTDVGDSQAHTRTQVHPATSTPAHRSQPSSGVRTSPRTPSPDENWVYDDEWGGWRYRGISPSSPRDSSQSCHPRSDWNVKELAAGGGRADRNGGQGGREQRASQVLLEELDSSHAAATAAIRMYDIAMLQYQVPHLCLPSPSLSFVALNTRSLLPLTSFDLSLCLSVSPRKGKRSKTMATYATPPPMMRCGIAPYRLLVCPHSTNPKPRVCYSCSEDVITRQVPCLRSGSESCMHMLHCVHTCTHEFYSRPAKEGDIHHGVDTHTHTHTHTHTVGLARQSQYCAARVPICPAGIPLKERQGTTGEQQRCAISTLLAFLSSTCRAACARPRRHVGPTQRFSG
jgi:hypothetical protein